MARLIKGGTRRSAARTTSRSSVLFPFLAVYSLQLEGRFMNHRLLCALALTTACGSSSSKAPNHPEPSTEAATVVEEDWAIDPLRESMVLSSPAGTRIEVAPVISPSRPNLERHFLLRAQGTQSDYDGAVVIVERRRNNDHQFYIAQLKGEPVWLLQYFPQNSTWKYAGYDSVSRRGELVAAEEVPVDGAKLLALRKRQKGTKLATIESRDRASQMEWQEKSFRELKETLPGQCQGLDARIDWDSVPDEAFTQTSMVSECAPPLLAIRDFCTRHPDYQEQAAAEISLVCRYHGEPGETEATWAFAPGKKGELIYVPGEGRDRWSAMLEVLRTKFAAHKSIYRRGKLLVLIDLGRESSTVRYGRDGVFLMGSET